MLDVEMVQGQIRENLCASWRAICEIDIGYAVRMTV